MKTFVIALSLIAGLLVVQGCAEKKPKPVKKNVQYVSGADEVTYIKLGNEIVDTVQNTLKKHLMAAMKSGGPAQAVSFCNAKAMKLTERYSDKYFTDVKRVSDRNRNPLNEPNEKELMVIEDFKKTLEAGDPISPKIAIDADGKKHYYAPIFTGGACLACHGNPKNMQPELISALDSLYPADKAIDYKVDEIRGIWSVKFKNS